MDSVNYLLTDELKYEISIRGSVPKPTQEDRRKQLRVLLKREESQSPQSRISPYDFDTDLAEMQVTFASLQGLVADFNENSLSSISKRISARIAHLSSRYSRVVSENDKQKSVLSSFDDELMLLEGEFLLKVDSYELSKLNIRDNTLAAASSPVTSVPRNTSPVKHYVPVWKWNLHFSGDSSKESLTAFLERVKELRESRGVSQDDLFSSATDLFAGSALIWFRSVKHTVHTWAQLEAKLRETFLSPFYDEDLLSEIKRRTQGDGENVLMFIATIQGLFSKLSSPPSEVEQVRMIRRNLLPYFIGQMALQDISTFSDLNRLCKQLETSRQLMNDFKPPPSRKANRLLEPSLAYTAVDDSVVAISTSLICWNCRKPDHVYSRCPETRTLFCFGCGKQGVTKSSCPICSNYRTKQRVFDQGETKNEYRGILKGAAPAGSNSRPSKSNIGPQTGTVRKQPQNQQH